MNGFSYSLRRNSLLMYNRTAHEGDSFYSVISNELSQKDELKVKVVWNNRCSVLIPSVIFRIEEMYEYISCITSIEHLPQCIQCGEFVAVWNTDERMEHFNEISEHLGVSISHTHQRVEHIISTPDDTIFYSLFDKLLYISERLNGKLRNSYVAEVKNVNDVLYYIKSTRNNDTRMQTSLPDGWMAYLNNYINKR